MGQVMDLTTKQMDWHGIGSSLDHYLLLFAINDDPDCSHQCDPPDAVNQIDSNALPWKTKQVCTSKRMGI